MKEQMAVKQMGMNGHELATATVPTPTGWYRVHRKISQMTQEPGAPAVHIPVPLTIPIQFRGPRVLIWKQDPSVAELGVRKVYLPRRVFTGPKDARIHSKGAGLDNISPNTFGDFIHTPGTDTFDAVHTFAVVRMTLTMFQRALAGEPMPVRLVPWQWNGATNTAPLHVYAHGLPGVMNAYYSRSARCLKFGDFNMPNTTPPERVYTCRSFDIVSHEAGHAILDGLKPNWIGVPGNPPQTGGLHEAFGDLTAIFLALSQLDLVEAVIAMTKSDLHNKIFLSDMAEQFGLALGRPNGLRNADNDLKLSEVTNEVHAISQVFTGAIYDILADIFAMERKPAIKDDAAVLYEAGQYVFGLVLRAYLNAPEKAATYAHVANEMLALCYADGKPWQYRRSIYQRFEYREVFQTVAFTEKEYQKEFAGKPMDHRYDQEQQDRSACCGTMQLPEFLYKEAGKAVKGEDELLEEEAKELAAAFKKK